MSQCFAYSRQRQRCDQEAGHDGDHAVSTTWGDDECFDPTIILPAPPVPTSVISVTNTARPIPIIGYDDDMDDLGAVAGGGCFSCGCLDDLHPCEAHGCRSFVP